MIHLQGNINRYYESETIEMVSYGSGGSPQQHMRELPGALKCHSFCVYVCVCVHQGAHVEVRGQFWV